MKFTGLFLLLSLVIIAYADNHDAKTADKVKTDVTAAATTTATAAKTVVTAASTTAKAATTTATTAASTVASTVASTATKAGNDIVKSADALAGKTEEEILLLRGTFNGTDTTDMGFTYNYKEGGKDWPKLKSKYGVENNCGKETNQSPVNLLQPIWSYGWAYGDTIPK